MMSIYMFQKIRQLKAQGKKKSQIARELGVNRKTVNKYLRSNAPPKYSSRKESTREDLFAPFEPRVKNLLVAMPKLTAREIFELLCDEGYRGSERTIDRRIAKLRDQKPKERFFEQNYEPAEQAQFDFKECVELPFIEGSRLVQLHFGTLPHSDICFVRAYPNLTYECFMDGVHFFFEQIGGLTENIRIDNLSPCVSKVLKGRARKWTKNFERAIMHYGFGVLACSPGRGNEKGDVERDIRTYAARIRNLCINKGIIFKDWDELNEWLLEYMTSRHSNTSKELLQQERKKLLPLPPYDEQVVCRVEVSPATSHGTVRISHSSYSVPDNLIGLGCRIVSGPYEVRIYRVEGKGEFLAIHLRVRENEHSILLEHVLPSLVRKPQAMVRWAHRAVLFPSPVFKRFYGHIKKIESSSAEREFLRCINLIHHTTFSEIGAAMELVLEAEKQKQDQSNPQPFDELRNLLLGHRSPCDVIDITERTAQRPLSPKLSDYDSFIPRTKGTKP